MNELHTKIYNQIYDELRLRYKHDPDEDVIETAKEAALLAMEKQAEFFLWLILQVDSIDCEFDIIHQDGNFFRIERDESGQPIMHPNKITELELYEIWEEQKHE